MAARAGDRLLVLFPPNQVFVFAFVFAFVFVISISFDAQGWVYVRNTRGREGYLPEDCVDIC